MPTLVCVPIMVEPGGEDGEGGVDAALADARAAKEAGADLVEFRVDRLLSGLGASHQEGGNEAGDAFAVGEAERLAAESALPCIVTCRPTWEGGLWEGDDAARLDALRRIATAERPPRYVDVELAAFQRDPLPAMQLAAASGEGSSRLIVSTHDFEGRPEDLARRLLRAREISAASVIKVAYRARSLRDNLDLFETLQQGDRPGVALGMGEFGLASRVLTGKFGGWLTFAGLREASTTAPGQPTVGQLLGELRFRSIGERTRLYGVIGWPVAQSMSPAIHNAVFAHLGEDAVYLPLPVAASDDREATYHSLQATLPELIDHPRLGFAGASVTLPHKEPLLRLADKLGWEVEPAARGIGAANTVCVDRAADGSVEHVRISNTDAPAALGELEELLDGSVRGRRILVLGAGGAARAVAYSAMLEGASVMIAGRDAGRAKALADAVCAHAEDLGPGFASECPVEAISLSDVAGWPADAVVNCTPVGMTGGPDPVGIPLDVAALARLSPGVAVFDTVYNPLETPLVAAARAAGLRAAGGLGMFVAQAALQTRAWTRRDAPLDLIERVVRERLAPPAGRPA